MSMCERNINQLPPVCAPTRDYNLQPQYAPWLRIEPATFWCMRPPSNQMSLTARLEVSNFIRLIF